ncbi:cytochrome oxidase c subunit VIb-domain-containing protein [Annulohypoxylon maeteangense]|uniref:cytochrome oxidase c subunit VIb-domain-containing protein n=1 Tax=Annulohypoxylon maeteangense TaxID=1927788 RepID=UPI0020081EB9|nr:cytochrome oxidase c subunit VIb-domain-containing protein [Annulohypoxylon maeteangense]KAI0886501.1 cytochrome oxidase c subunit VIb-domain-containing protein [Annulohypoxylon maeteangense]
MGLFGFFSSADEQRKQEVRTGARAPDRTERKKCWDARDDFFKCLDKHDVLDSTKGDGKKIAEKQCAKEHKGFEDNCATAWVDYFKRFRVADAQKKQTLKRLEKEGAGVVAVNDMPGKTS